MMTDPETIEAERHDQILYRHVLIIALLVIIAASTVASAILDLMNRNEAREVARELESVQHSECMDAEDTTSTECDALFPEGSE